MCILAPLIVYAFSLSLSPYVSSHTLPMGGSDVDGVRRYAREAPKNFDAEIIPEEVPIIDEIKCTSNNCYDAAIEIRSYLNESVDPCDDFYAFACGNFTTNSELAEGRGMVDPFSFLSDVIQEQLHEIMSEPSSKDELKPYQLAKDFYLACLNETIIEDRGMKPLADLLKELGGWPVVEGDSWSEDDFNWIETVKKFRRMGLETQSIFSLYIDTDLRNSSRRILYIDQTDLNIHREYLINEFDDNSVLEYYGAMINSSVHLGADSERAENELISVVELAIDLANISIPREELRNGDTLYNPYTIEQLQTMYPYVNWLDYINAFMTGEQQVDKNEIVINLVPTFFEKLGTVLESTPKRTIANYLLWRAVYMMSSALTNEFRNHESDEDEDPRWKACIQLTSEKFPVPVSILYGRKYFDDESIKTAVNFVNDIRGAFIDILHQADWLDEKTKRLAITKAKTLRTYIGFPNEAELIEKIEEFYQNLTVDPNDFFNNIRQFEKFETDYMFQNLRKPVTKLNWDTLLILDLAAVNAYNQPNENSIQFPPTIFVKRFFSPDRPQFMNYGIMGSIIGHEITHSLDDEGRQFDLDGNLAEWWDPQTKDTFLKRVQCIIEQYDNYTDHHTNMTLNGIATQGENIADNGGAKQAYYAYKKWIKRNGPEYLLPELKYQPEQLFWISYAQSWCAVYEDYFLEYQITVDDHVPNEFRVNGVISNMPANTFAHDFSCPIGTNMNPVKKCTVW